MLTLVEAAKTALNNGETQKSAVIEIYARTAAILRVLPYEDIPGNALAYNLEDALPGIGFRGVNEGYTESTGVINPKVESLVISGGDLDVDVFITETMGRGQRAAQEIAKIKALAHTIGNAFIKGDTDTNAKQFDGLQKRLVGNQLIANGSSSGGDPLSISKLEEAIDAVDEPTHLLMSKAVRRRITAATRAGSVSGTINYTQDEFGRQQTMFGELPILEMDPNDSIFQTLAFNEANPGGGSTVGTSIYVVSLGLGKLNGIQNGGVRVRDIGELNDKPSERTRIEWYQAMAMYHPRAASRLWGISDAPAVA